MNILSEQNLFTSRGLTVLVEKDLLGHFTIFCLSCGYSVPLLPTCCLPLYSWKKIFGRDMLWFPSHFPLCNFYRCSLCCYHGDNINYLTVRAIYFIFFIILTFLKLGYSWCIVSYRFQVNTIFKSYTPFVSYYKILAIFPVLYNTSLQLFKILFLNRG